MLMVSAISSSASTILSSVASTSSSSSSDQLASLEAQLAEKKADLEQTQDEQEKATIQKSIDTLEVKIAKRAKAANLSRMPHRSPPMKLLENSPAKASASARRILTRPASSAAARLTSDKAHSVLLYL